MKKRRHSKLITFIHTLKKQIKDARIPFHSAKRATRKHTVHQLIIVFAPRKYLRKSYRDFAEILATMDSASDYIGLETMPHSTTTLHKAFARLEDFGEARGWKKMGVVVDGKGFVLWAHF